MSISLPTNKKEKRRRLKMRIAQGSITKSEANQMWRDYLRLFKSANGK